MFSILPGKEPKITYGGYQEEGLGEQEQHFYSEVMNQIVALNVHGSFHWQVALRNMSIGDEFFRVQTNNVQLDTGTSMILFNTKDYQKIAIALCKFVEDRASFKKLDDPPICVGKTRGQQRGEWKRMPLSISGCTPGVVEEMPHIKFQFDQYNFDLRPKKYLDYMRISRRMVDVNETDTVGICSVNIYPGEMTAGAIIGTPFLDDFY